MKKRKRVSDPLYVPRLAEPSGKDRFNGSLSFFKTGRQRIPIPFTTCLDWIGSSVAGQRPAVRLFPDAKPRENRIKDILVRNISRDGSEVFECGAEID